jgi:hypothetical protein
MMARVVAGQRGAVAALLEAAQRLARLGRDAAAAADNVPSAAAQTCKVLLVRMMLGLSSCVTWLPGAVLSLGQLGWS